MSIGAAKQLQTGVQVTPPVYSVNLNPGGLNTISSNGSATSSRINTEVIAGVGPYEYLWTITNPNIAINSPTSNSTTFTSGGFEDSEQGEATVTVTDKGNGDAQTDNTATIKFTFTSF